MTFLASVISLLNIFSNAFGRFCLAPVAVLPDWLSLALISAITGLFILLVFKYTSNQKAIARVKNDMKAQMLAIKLFKESISVTLKAQGRLFKGACLLLVHAIVPMLVMILPMSLLLAQMATWYQFRPLMPEEQAVVTVQLNEKTREPWPDVGIEPDEAFEVNLGPVRILSKRQICYDIKAVKSGQGLIAISLGRQRTEKTLAVGKDLMRISSKRPRCNWVDMLVHPGESPFAPDSAIQSIAIDYPRNSDWLTGSGRWPISFFVLSILVAFICKPVFKVRL